MTVANVVDHVVPHRGSWTAFVTCELQSLCAPCHTLIVLPPGVQRSPSATCRGKACLCLESHGLPGSAFGHGHLKSETIGRASILDGSAFGKKVKSLMLSLQRNPDKIRDFFQKPSLMYAA